MEASLPDKATLGEEQQGPGEYLVRIESSLSSPPPLFFFLFSAPHLVPSFACIVYANTRLNSALEPPEENMKSLSTMTQLSSSLWQSPTMPSLT
jgi:hypothetical protein